MRCRRRFFIAFFCLGVLTLRSKGINFLNIMSFCLESLLVSFGGSTFVQVFHGIRFKVKKYLS